MKSLNYISSIIKLTSLSCLLLLSHPVLGSGVSATAVADTNKIRIGEQFHVNLTAVAPAGVKVDFPLLADTFNHFEIVSRGTIDTVGEKGKAELTLKQQLTLTSFDSGFYVIPPMQFIVHQSGNTDTLSTEAALMTIVTVEVDTTKDFRPLKGILEVPFPWLDYLVWVIIAAAVIAIFYFVYKKYTSRPVVVVVKPVHKRPAHEIALEKLRKIEQEKLWAQGNVKKYYSDVTDVLRQYVEDRFSVFAMEQTTEEILRHFENNLIRPEEKEKLAYLLRLADMVKFAKVLTIPHENETSLQYAFDFVNNTRPVIKEDFKEEVKS